MSTEHDKVEAIRPHAPELADLVHLLLGTDGWALVNDRTAAPIRISIPRLLADLLALDPESYQRERAGSHMQMIQQQAARRLSELSDAELNAPPVPSFEEVLAEMRAATALAEATVAAARSGAPWPDAARF